MRRPERSLISKHPLANLTEFDPTPDNTGAEGEPAEEQLVRVDMPGIADVSTSRGFLTADVPDLGVTLVATHLKSSRGGAGSGDHDNAKKRELVAAAMARFVAGRLQADSAATVLVAGDMNVGETDLSKNGFRLEKDHFARPDGDLYDDTHAIFSAGLIDGLHMASLTKALGSETYDDPRFSGCGPIDCIYVVGKQAGDFTLSKKSPQTFGSDHFAVSTRFLFSGTAPTPNGGDPSPQPDRPGVRISAPLPNPEGEDEGKEWVNLKNTGNEKVHLIGWKLRDKAGHSVSLFGEIEGGEELRVNLRSGQMPLNNGGDEIELLDSDGRSIHKVTYRGGQALPGREIRFRP